MLERCDIHRGQSGGFTPLVEVSQSDDKCYIAGDGSLVILPRKPEQRYDLTLGGTTSGQKVEPKSLSRPLVSKLEWQSTGLDTKKKVECTSTYYSTLGDERTQQPGNGAASKIPFYSLFPTCKARTSMETESNIDMPSTVTANDLENHNIHNSSVKVYKSTLAQDVKTALTMGQEVHHVTGHEEGNDESGKLMSEAINTDLATQARSLALHTRPKRD